MVLKVFQITLLMVVKQRNMARDQYWIIRPRKMQSPSTFSVASNWLIRMKKKETKVLMKNGTLSFVKWYLHSSSISRWSIIRASKERRLRMRKTLFIFP